MKYSNWMAMISQHSLDIKFKDLLLPGTHDSAAYDIEWSQKPATFNSSWKKLGFKILSHIPYIKHKVENWVVTQQVDIKTQLEMGVRNFDFRIGCNDEGELYFSHSFLCLPVDEALKQVKEFQELHPKEILVLNFKVDYPFRDVAHLEEIAIEHITTSLGNNAIKNGSYDSSLLELQQEGSYFLNFYARNSLLITDESAKVFNINKTHELWPNTAELEKIAPKLIEQIEALDSVNNKYIYGSYILTADKDLIIAGIFSNKNIEYYAVKLDEKHEEILSLKSISNISALNVDYVSSDLIANIIALNEARIKSTTETELGDVLNSSEPALHPACAAAGSICDHDLKPMGEM